jgi:hypothetical protein
LVSDRAELSPFGVGRIFWRFKSPKIYLNSAFIAFDNLLSKSHFFLKNFFGNKPIPIVYGAIYIHTYVWHHLHTYLHMVLFEHCWPTF